MASTSAMSAVPLVAPDSDTAPGLPVVGPASCHTTFEGNYMSEIKSDGSVHGPPTLAPPIALGVKTDSMVAVLCLGPSVGPTAVPPTTCVAFTSTLTSTRFVMCDALVHGCTIAVSHRIMVSLTTAVAMSAVANVGVSL